MDRWLCITFLVKTLWKEKEHVFPKKCETIYLHLYTSNIACDSNSNVMLWFYIKRKLRMIVFFVQLISSKTGEIRKLILGYSGLGNTSRSYQKKESKMIRISPDYKRLEATLEKPKYCYVFYLGKSWLGDFTINRWTFLGWIFLRYRFSFYHKRVCQVREFTYL